MSLSSTVTVPTTGRPTCRAHPGSASGWPVRGHAAAARTAASGRWGCVGVRRSEVVLRPAGADRRERRLRRPWRCPFTASWRAQGRAARDCRSKRAAVCQGADATMRRLPRNSLCSRAAPHSSRPLRAGRSGDSTRPTGSDGSSADSERNAGQPGSRPPGPLLVPCIRRGHRAGSCRTLSRYCCRWPEHSPDVCFPGPGRKKTRPMESPISGEPHARIARPFPAARTCREPRNGKRPSGRGVEPSACSRLRCFAAPTGMTDTPRDARRRTAPRSRGVATGCRPGEIAYPAHHVPAGAPWRRPRTLAAFLPQLTPFTAAARAASARAADIADARPAVHCPSRRGSTGRRRPCARRGR